MSLLQKANLHRFTATGVAILALGAIAVTILATLSGLQAADLRPPESSKMGTAAADDPAPDFELEQMNGETFRLSDHRGEVVVINFWATWCPPCRLEIPGFVRLQDELRDEGVTFVGISLDEQGFEVVAPFAEEFGINYPLVVDDGKVAYQYGGVAALPTTFVVDRQGHVTFAWPGFLPETVLREQLAPLLEDSGSSS